MVNAVHNGKLEKLFFLNLFLVSGILNSGNIDLFVTHLSSEWNININVFQIIFQSIASAIEY